MSHSQDQLYSIVESFFICWEEDDFQSGTVLTKECQKAWDEIERELEALERGKYSDACLLELFKVTFLKAKHIVEISYEYNKAVRLYKMASRMISLIQRETFGPLGDFSDIQVQILNIDRGIYTGYAKGMSDAAERLQKSISLIQEKLAKADSEDEHVKLMHKLSKKLMEDNIYAQGIVEVSALYLNRWEKREDFGTRIERVKEAVAFLEENSNTRLASDLAPHLHVLERFEKERGDAGKLFIQNGEIVFYYYATLDHRISETFNSLMYTFKDISNTKDASVIFNDEFGTATTIVPEEMSDIWFGLDAQNFINTYVFEGKDLKIMNFRELDFLKGRVALRYYTMGIFELKITFTIDNAFLVKAKDGLSLTAMRHLVALATPFALDDKILYDDEQWQEALSFIGEFADIYFEKLDALLLRRRSSEALEKEVENEGLRKALIMFNQDKTDAFMNEADGLGTFLNRNVSQNRFTSIRINNLIEKEVRTRDHKRVLREVRRMIPETLKKHFQFPALIMPVREVRSAIDNWIMYDQKSRDENLALTRYNDSEWLSINRYSSIVMLLEQPVWVFDQAIESVEVASAIINLLDLSNQYSMKKLEQLDSERKEITKWVPSKELEERKKLIEKDIKNLDRFYLHISRLLETVEAGKIMTYPDHTEMMQKVFETMRLKKFKDQTEMLLLKIKDKREKSMEYLKKIENAEIYRQQKTIKLLVSFASIFIALGSLKDLFEIWNGSSFIKEHNFLIATGDRILEIVAFLALLSISILVYNHYKDRKKK